MMRTTADPDAIERRPHTPRLNRLRRKLVHRANVRPATPLREASRPTMRRVWREVAPGEWRWLHAPDEMVPK
jgi:hypothetical protein